MPYLVRVAVWIAVAALSAGAAVEAVAAQSCPEVGFTIVEPSASGRTRPVKFWRGGPLHLRRDMLTTTADITEVSFDWAGNSAIGLKFRPEAGARLEAATTGRPGLRLAFVADDEALLSVTWQGEYGMGRESAQVSLADEGRARELYEALRRCVPAPAGR